MTDEERLDWLEKSDSRLQDVYWTVQNEGMSVRMAIDHLQVLQDSEITKDLRAASSD